VKPDEPIARDVSPPGDRFGRLRRVTSTGRFLPEVDGLRCIAVLGVFLFHLTYVVAGTPGEWASPPAESPLLRFAAHGHYGVELFFVISGFVLGLSFVRAADPRYEDRFSVRRYFGRRLSRLEPPYLFSLFALFALLVLLRKGTLAELLPHLTASCLYVHNVAYGDTSTINPVAWSLEVEVQFYVLAPLLALPLRWTSASRRRGVYVAGIAAALGLRWWTISQGWTVPASLPVYLHYFLVGILLADVHVRNWNERSPDSAWGDLGVLLLTPAIVASWFAPYAAAQVLFPLLLAPWFAAVLASRRTRAWLSRPVAVVVGGMCYTIYLWHIPVLWVCQKASAVIPRSSHFAIELGWRGVVFGTATLLVCGVLFVLVERPCMRAGWPRRLGRGVLAAWRSRPRAFPSTRRRTTV
jgi:peptidoglycan/LPS O-acetylase OafA/YrhL